MKPQTTGADEEEDDVRKIAVGNKMPDFTCTCSEGKEHKLSDYRGTKVMVCFYRHCLLYTSPSPRDPKTS
eukprot:10898662-Ditylum_brightwellii.AAC.1